MNLDKEALERATLPKRLRERHEKARQSGGDMMYLGEGEPICVEAAVEIERLEKLAIKIRWEGDDAYIGRIWIGWVSSQSNGWLWSCHINSQFKLGARDHASAPSEQLARAAVERAAVEALTKGAENG